MFLELSDYAVALRRELHSHPEVSGREYHTAQVIERELDKLGIAHQRVGETGVYAVLHGTAPGPIRALRADTDALPVQEQTGAAYQSTVPGVMHACGHDMHTAALLTAIKVLGKLPLRGELRLFFQQAEEIGGGAKQFISAGLLAGVTEIVGVHAASDLPVGTVCVAPGPNNASCDYFRAALHGCGAHVSKPHLGVDALYAASELVVALQAIVARHTDPLDPVVVGVGCLNAGTAYNAIAEEAVLEGTTRCFSHATRQRVNELVRRTAESIAGLHGARVDFALKDFAPPLVNDPSVCKRLQGLFGQIPEISILTAREKAMGADDFAEYLQLIPGAYAYVGTRNDQLPNTAAPHHNGHFDIDESAVLIAARLYAAYGLAGEE